MRTSFVILTLLFCGAANAATPVQRYTSVMTGLLDAAPTAAQSQAVSDAIVATLTDAQCTDQFGHVCASLTNVEKATVVVQTIRRDLRNRVTEYQRQAATATAQAAIEAAAAAGRAIIVTPEDPAAVAAVVEIK